MSKEEANIPLGEGEEEVEVTLEDSGKENEEASAKEEATTSSEEKTPSAKKDDHGDDDDELESYSEGVKKRIGRLTYKARENERQRDEALALARSIKEENDNLRRETIRKDMALANEYENRLKLQENRAKTLLRAAIESGDADKQADLQAELSALSVEFERVRTAKVNIEAAGRQVGLNFTRRGEREAEEVRESAPQRQQQSTQVQAPQIKPDPKAEEWAARNEWFGTDENMTHTAFRIHNALVAEEGFDPASDDYYQELDRRMRAAFPAKFKRESKPAEEKTTYRPQQAVAGARPNASVSRPKSIKLTPSQVAIARKLGISVEDYARHLQKLQG